MDSNTESDRRRIEAEPLRGQPLDETVEESLRENREAIRRLATL